MLGSMDGEGKMIGVVEPLGPSGLGGDDVGVCGPGIEGAPKGTLEPGLGHPLSKEPENRSATSVEANVGSHTCSHCSRAFGSRNLLFKHLYEKHDGDGEGAALKSKLDLSLLGCADIRPLMAIDDFKGHPSPVLKPHEIDEA